MVKLTCDDVCKMISLVAGILLLLSHVCLLVTPWTAARKASLSFTISLSLLKLMSIESVTPFNHLILCHPLLLLPSVLPSIRIFSSESALCIRWSKYWSFSIRAGNGSSQFSWWLPDKNAVLLYTIYFLFPPRKATSLNFHVIFSHFLHVGS